MKRFATLLFAALFLVCSILPVAAYDKAIDTIPAAYASATHVPFATELLDDNSEDRTSNARYGNNDNYPGEYYVYLKGDNKGDHTVTFTVDEAGTYSYGFTLFVFGTGKTRATRVKIDNGDFIDIRETNTEDQMNKKQYITGFETVLTAGEHTVTLSLPTDFDDSNVKTLYFRDFFFVKNVEDTPDTPDTGDNDNTPETPDNPNTGDMTVAAIAIAAVASLGAVLVINKKRV